ncbi:swr complex subunit [Actinomortierella ambigua]|nr:swr complex subunit [Actinomortierella ambigua]
MATGSDVRDIFQLKPASDQVKRAPRTEKKPDGISRELYGLIGNNVSTVAFNNPAYKPKLNLRTKAVSWTWRPFVNPMRDDDMVLHHWQKTMTDPNEEYFFSRYNKIINLQEYTPEEYTKHLQDSDWTMEETAYLWDLCRRFDLRWVLIQDRYEWPPREEDAMAYRTIAGVVPKPESSAQAQSSQSSSSTDAVTTSGAAPSNAMDTTPDSISTQIQPNGASSTLSTPSTTSDATAIASLTPAAGATSSTSVATTPAEATPAPASVVVKKEEVDVVRKVRTMEDLKARYYAINRTLIRLRMSDSSQAVEKAQLLSSMAYDKNREIERKKNLEILNTRTPEQIEEEEALYLEARRIDQNEKKITKERESLLRLLNLRDMYGPGGPASAGLSAGGSLVGGGGSGIIIPSNSINISSGPSSALPGKGSTPATPVTPTAAGSAAAAAAASAGGAATSSNAASATAAPTAAPTTTAGSGSNKKRKKNTKQTEDSTPASASSTKGGSSSNNRRPSNASTADAATATGNGGASASNAPVAASSPSSAIANAVPAPVKKEKLTPGAYLRSQKMTPIVSTKIARVQATLAQLGMPYKPNMPTALVMAKWDQLQTNIVTLLDLKKHVDKLENDLKVNKLRQTGGKGANANAGAGAGAGGAASSSSGTAAGGQGGNAPGSLGLLPASSTGLGGTDGDLQNTHYGVKREGAPDDASTTGQIKKKKSRKE